MSYLDTILLPSFALGLLTHQVGEGEERQRDRVEHRAELRDTQQPQVIDAVDQSAGEQGEQNRRARFGQGHGAEPGGRMGQFPGHPADGDALHPQAERRSPVADDVIAVIGNSEGAAHGREPAWEFHPSSLKRRKCRCRGGGRARSGAPRRRRALIA